MKEEENIKTTENIKKPNTERRVIEEIEESLKAGEKEEESGKRKKGREEGGEEGK